MVLYCFAARPFLFWAGAARLINMMHRAIGIMAFEKRICLGSFDAATERFGFRLFDCFTGNR
jgi:hypothetical protein